MIRETGLDMLDFSKFIYLEELSMSPYNITGCETPANAIKKLSAPNLQCLNLDFETDWLEFTEERTKWIQEFAALLDPQSKLKKIFLKYDGLDDPHYCPSTIPWPWAIIDAVKQCVEQLGLTLEYSRPKFTREEWDNMVERNGEDCRYHREVPWCESCYGSDAGDLWNEVVLG
ncbi:hypothetical protein F5884DRAFT_789127 [Xylogone sp. PMI_703]|nr:hypothetical protein F5884DRAFT_789127 [Xylogone sp. PMI_703]